MNTNKPGPIKDFEALAKVWGNEQKPIGPASNVSKASLGPVPQPQSGPEQGSPAQPISSHAASTLSLPATPPPLIADLQQRLKDRSLEIEQLRSQLAAVEQELQDQRKLGLDAKALQAAQELVEQRQSALASGEQALARDRAVFEAELAELDQVKSREAAVAEREKECAERQAAIEKKEAKLEPIANLQKEVRDLISDLAASEASLRSAKGQLTRKINELNAASEELVQAQGQLAQERKKSRELRAKVKEISQEASFLSEQRQAAVRQLDRTKTELARAQAQLMELKGARGEAVDLCVGDEALLQWLGQDGQAESIAFFAGCELGWTGVGSYESEAFDRLLDELGFVQRNLPHETISHVVVGREGWSREELTAQIACRAGQTLRIYSQEMLLAAFMTGRDPLDADEDVLEAFKRGHPALEYLAESDFDWPAVDSADTSVIDELGIESVRVKESPLNLLGYHVGLSSDLTPTARRRILQDAFQRSKLPWVESDAYMSKWGAAGSHQRLWRIATHIAWLANTQGRDQRKEIAQGEWVDDLAWLRKTIYVPRRYRFTWPDAEVL
jgi:hypothetical protein